MPTWYKTITSGSDAHLNRLIVDNEISASQFSGSFRGNGSSLTGIVSASYALSASYAPSTPSVSASYAATSSFITSIFSEGGTFADPINGISFSSSFTVFRAPYTCQVSAMYGKRVGGNDCFVNARKSGSGGYSYHTASNLTITGTDRWFVPNSITNTDYAIGDTLELIISGSANSQIAIQLDFIRI